MINSLLTGSKKYGTVQKMTDIHRDIDIVVRVDSKTCDLVWGESENPNSCMFSKVRFIRKMAGDFAIIEFGGDMPIVRSRFPSRDYQALKSISTDMVLTKVNLIPCKSWKIWSIWRRGTKELFKMRPVTRDEAIKHFTKLGMPRFNSHGDEE